MQNMWRILPQAAALTAAPICIKTWLAAEGATLSTVQRRFFNNLELDSRFKKTTSGWFSRRGQKAGHPETSPLKLRVIGVDKSLQERLDEMYQPEKVANRRDIGEPCKPLGARKMNRSKMMEHRKLQRANSELERAARHNLLKVSLDEVGKEHLDSGGLFQDIFDAAELYGIYEDLLGKDLYFTPTVNLRMAYPCEGDMEIPVCRGNIIKPREAREEPHIELPLDSSSNGLSKQLWTLVMTNLDCHFKDENSEYLHYMVSNICQGENGVQGDVVCPYLPPFPAAGTGFHRFVFVLYKQTTASLNLSEYKQPPIQESVNLEQRTFRTRDFWEKFSGSLTPVGLSFFQSDFDSSVQSVFHDLLCMKEPKFEYQFIPPYVRPWNSLYRDHNGWKGFNLFLDKFRDRKEIQEEVLKKRLKTFDPLEGDLDSQIKYPNAHPPNIWNKQDRIKHGTWRLREIERERLRKGYFKDLDWFHPRRDPTNA